MLLDLQSGSLKNQFQWDDEKAGSHTTNWLNLRNTAVIYTLYIKDGQRHWAVTHWLATLCCEPSDERGVDLTEKLRDTMWSHGLDLPIIR